MKLVAPEEGRSLQLISMDEVRPLRGGLFPLEAMAKIIAKYQFASHPTTYEPNTTVKFQTGITKVGDLQIPIMGLEIYGDGVLVSTRNTDDSDLVMDQFIIWVIDEFNYRNPKTIVPRKYISRIVVDVDDGFDTLANAFGILSVEVSQALNAEKDNLSIANLQIGPFPPAQYPYQSTWHFERRIIEPFVSNRYLSTAPLSTTAHYEFLERLEIALRGI